MVDGSYMDKHRCYYYTAAVAAVVVFVVVLAAFAVLLLLIGLLLLRTIGTHNSYTICQKTEYWACQAYDFHISTMLYRERFQPVGLLF
jgi:hypothetical protein